MTFQVNVHDLAFEDLVESNLLAREGLAAARAAQARDGGTVADWLYALGLVDERDLLRALAQRLGRQYVTMQKVAALKVEAGLLEKVPLRLAEHHEVLPVRLDEGGTLWLLTPAPVNDEALHQKLMQLTGAAQLEWVLALGAAVRAAVKRHYRLELEAFEATTLELPHARATVGGRAPAAELTCPACRARVQPGAFKCPSCLLLLNDDEVQDLEGSEVLSIVQGMLLPPEDWPAGAERTAPELQATATDVEPRTKETQALPGAEVPEIAVALDQMGSLAPLEASLFVHVDGVKTVEQIAAAMGLTAIEAGFALAALKERGYIAAAVRVPHDPLAEPHLESLEQDSRKALQLAVSLELLGEWQAAVKALVTGIGRLKQPAPLLNKLALLLIARNRDYQTAADLLERAAQLEPGSEVYRKNLEKVRRRA